LGPSQKTLRHSWCPKLIAGLVYSIFDVLRIECWSCHRWKI